MEARWHVPDPSTLLWEHWDTEYSLFDRETGETHLINALPAEILRILSQKTISGKALAEEMAVDCDVECTLDWQRKIEGIIRNLYAIGLIEQARE